MTDTRSSAVNELERLRLEGVERAVRSNRNWFSCAAVETGWWSDGITSRSECRRGWGGLRGISLQSVYFDRIRHHEKHNKESIPLFLLVWFEAIGIVDSSLHFRVVRCTSWRFRTECKRSALKEPKLTIIKSGCVTPCMETHQHAENVSYLRHFCIHFLFLSIIFPFSDLMPCNLLISEEYDEKSESEDVEWHVSATNSRILFTFLS